MQSPISSTFVSSTHALLLRQHQLATFEQLWQYQGDWFEPPNQERGGWSGVNYIELTDESGQLHGFYLKRQQGHMRKTWRHPIMGEPTFLREYKLLTFLKSSKVVTPKLVYFAYEKDQSILLTEALTGFLPAYAWFKNHAVGEISKKRRLIHALAKMVQHMHNAGVQHRSLYLKHLFVKEHDGDFEVALIDFEKSRITYFIHFFKIFDLMTLHHRTLNLTRTNKLYFFKSYFEIKRLLAWHKCLCRYLNKKLQKKRTQT